jgi:hypothetical protein
MKEMEIVRPAFRTDLGAFSNPFSTRYCQRMPSGCLAILIGPTVKILAVEQLNPVAGLALAASGPRRRSRQAIRQPGLLLIESYRGLCTKPITTHGRVSVKKKNAVHRFRGLRRFTLEGSLGLPFSAMNL